MDSVLSFVNYISLAISFCFLIPSGFHQPYVHVYIQRYLCQKYNYEYITPPHLYAILAKYINNRALFT